MKTDLSKLSEMEYSGRTVMIGRTPNGDIFSAYALTGRSDSSQARTLVKDKNRTNFGDIETIRTAPTDLKALKEGNPSLLIYDAMEFYKGNMAVSNGQQTKIIMQGVIDNHINDYKNHNGEVLTRAMIIPVLEWDVKNHKYINITAFEPDSLNTARVCALINNGSAALYIVGYSETGEFRKTFLREYDNGNGSFISTYNGWNEKPAVLPFKGESRNILMGENTAQGIAEKVFEAIEGGSKPEDNFQVSAAAMVYNSQNGLEKSVINRFE